MKSDRGNARQRRELLAQVYDRWRAHHASCLKCRQERDWYNPGAPRIVAPDDPIRDGVVAVTDQTSGRRKVVGFCMAPDPASVLCKKGVKLFRDWQRLAVTLAIPPELWRSA